MFAGGENIQHVRVDTSAVEVRCTIPEHTCAGAGEFMDWC